MQYTSGKQLPDPGRCELKGVIAAELRCAKYVVIYFVIDWKPLGNMADTRTSNPNACGYTLHFSPSVLNLG